MSIHVKLNLHYAIFYNMTIPDINDFRMSRDEAIDYIADHTAIPRSQIVKEVDRYITWPGQACAYKMGELEILRLRRKAEQELGMSQITGYFHHTLINGFKMVVECILYGQNLFYGGPLIIVVIGNC